MSRNPIFLLLLLRLLLLLLLPVFLPLTQCSTIRLDENEDLIDKTCKQTPHYDLCLSSLQSNPESSNADVKGLAKIMVDVLLSTATDAQSFIEGLIKQAPEPGLERSLAFCAELYIPIVKYTLPQAIYALSNGQYKFASYGISDAAKEAIACEKKFSGSTNSPLSDRNNLVESLSEVATAILNILLKG
jgi:pectinesterase inhibitor-like protein